MEHAVSNFWTTDDTSKAGAVTVHTPTGTTVGSSVPHTDQVYINGVPHSTK
jgi:hypothetical protein